MDEKRDFMGKLDYFIKNIEIPSLLIHRPTHKLHNGSNIIAPKSHDLRMIFAPFPPSPVIFPQNPRPSPYCRAGLSKAPAAWPYWQTHPYQ